MQRFVQYIHVHEKAWILTVAALVLLLAVPVQAAKDPFASYRLTGIVVAQEADMAPMSFTGLNGEPKGYIIDLWRKWSAETGVPVHFHLVDWKDTLTAVRDGKADVHGGLFFTTERDRYLDYTTPFFPSKGGLFVQKGSGLKDFVQFSGRRVGVVESSFYHNYMLNNLAQFEPVTASTAEELVVMAETGEVDAFLADYPTLMYQLGTMGATSGFEVVEFYSQQEFRAAVAEGDLRTLTMVEAGLELIDDNERSRIFNRWIVGEEASSSGWLLPLSLGSLAILLLSAAVPLVFCSFPRQDRSN